MQQAAVAVVGGGILGLATAYHLTQRAPDRRVVVLEKEDSLGKHQTGHNSGVLHSGIYYKPGSLKAINCRDGKKAMEAFCAAEGIDYDICGKVIVATSEAELPALQRIYERGQANGVRCAIIEQAHLRELEPAAAGIKAIHVPESGIVDYLQVCERLASRIRERDGRIVTNARVTGKLLEPPDPSVVDPWVLVERNEISLGRELHPVVAEAGDDVGQLVDRVARVEHLGIERELHGHAPSRSGA